MGLSRLDSKKCQTILRHKSQLIENPALSISSENIDDNKKLDEYGEKAVRRLIVQHKEFTQEDIDKMIVAYNNGKSTHKLAEDFGCSKTTISGLLKKQGVNVTNRKALKKLNADTVITMYEEMHTSEEIAKHYSVHPQAIIRCLKENGIKIRSRWDYCKE